MKYELTDTIVMVTEECCECGTIFAMTAALRDSFLRTGDSFYCPNGHRQHYTESTEEKLRKAKEAAEWWKSQANEKGEELQRTRKQLSSTKGQLTKTKKRIAGGVCPCCNRQFVSLHRHMKTKHPDYQEETPEA